MPLHLNQTNNDKRFKVATPGRIVLGNEQRLIQAQRLAKIGDFTWDIDTGEVTWSEALFELLGYDRSERMDYARVNTEIHHPDDLERITQWLNHCIASGETELTPLEYRIFRYDRQVITVRTIGTIEYEQDRPRRIFATVQDITERTEMEEALRTSERKLTQDRRRFEQILDCFPYGIYIVGRDFSVEYVNLPLRKEFGDPAGRKCHDYFHDLPHPCPWCQNDQVFQGETVRWEWHSDKTGRDYELIDIPLPNTDGSISKLEVFHDITDEKQAEARLMAYQKQLKSLTSALILAEERLKQSLAIQLHDNISQSLAMLRVQMAQLSHTIAEEKAHHQLQAMYESVAGIIQETQNLTAELHYPLLGLQAFEKAVYQWSLDMIQMKYNIPVYVHDDKQSKPLTEDVQTVLFRGTRELLINIVKHAQANRVDIIMRREENNIVVEIKDDGIGFDIDILDESDSRSFGVLSVSETLEKLGGSLVCNSKPNQGCVATLTAPLKTH